ncbi:MAG TPA: phosphoribosylformylglycinamidine synthase subunit PurQ [Patescibacteria group bacterium]|nr:phosphoribosylformylglycinamidine synthase subunit PurQ [Patescibacteria group bacterium]
MKYGVVVFPGSNCDNDAFYAASENSGANSQFLWHKDTSIPQDIDVIILPGGFSYGDYLRCGAIARFSPIMREVVNFASKGGLVMGICNGFQILVEAGMLPGVLLKNTSQNFICRDVFLKTVNTSTPFTSSLSDNDIMRMPIAHGEGNYFADADTIKSLQDNNQVVFQYCDEAGNITAGSNYNGSINSIAGIVNKSGNVLGMMPHPERACDALLGNTDGLGIFRSLNLHFLQNRKSEVFA